jgi:hypothetical protein
MPSLGKHDGLATKLVPDTLMIDQARAKNEISVQTSLGLLVLTQETRSRLEAISASLKAKGSSSELTVNWVMDDGVITDLTADRIDELVQEALALVGEKTQRAYAYAQVLKSKFRDGEKVTFRDIAPEKWL